jgi:hypothetical protein
MSDPLFVNAAGGDYHLVAPRSPCIDRGNSAAVTWATDLDGQVRIHGRAVDMGAYESAFNLGGVMIILR